jgi:hypothetical protein
MTRPVRCLRGCKKPRRGARCQSGRTVFAESQDFRWWVSKGLSSLWLNHRALLSNAFKFTEQGGVNLIVSVAAAGWSDGHPIPDSAASVIAQPQGRRNRSGACHQS